MFIPTLSFSMCVQSPALLSPSLLSSPLSSISLPATTSVALFHCLSHQPVFVCCVRICLQSSSEEMPGCTVYKRALKDLKDRRLEHQLTSPHITTVISPLISSSSNERMAYFCRPTGAGSLGKKIMGFFKWEFDFVFFLKHK